MVYCFWRKEGRVALEPLVLVVISSVTSVKEEDNEGGGGGGFRVCRRVGRFPRRNVTAL